MYFNKVEIKNFRNIVSASFSPSPSLNIISGSNGSGKSTLLEALYYLATGTSFRTHRLSHVVSHNSNCFTLFSIASNSSSQHRIGLSRCRDLNHQSRLDGKDINRRSELVQLLPLQLISPESISLLTEGSEHRRNYTDWVLFHVEHSFHYHLTQYLRALKQRNALLRSGSLSGIDHWDSLLVEHGVIIDNRRLELVDSLRPILNKTASCLLPGIELDLTYRSGWHKGASLKEALQSSLETDLKLKHTTVGPHRADIVLKTQGAKVNDVLSRGQIKLIVVALKLSQLSLLHYSTRDLSPIILVDDLAAELDIEHRALMMQTIQALSSQLFITTPDLSLLNYSGWKERKVFHVEHGQVKEVV